MKKTETTLKTLRLRQDVVEKVQIMADNDNRTFTNMVETILLNTSPQQMA